MRPSDDFGIKWVLVLHLYVLGLIGWLLFLTRSFSHMATLSRDAEPPLYWLYDWHVYYAGARDLVERDLYSTLLVLRDWPLPTPVFNQAPGAALIAIPLLPLGRELGGLVWLTLGVLALGLAAVAAAYLAGIDRVAAWSGVLVAMYSAVYFFIGSVTLGNINHLLLAIVAGFAIAHVRGRQRLAGVLLGVAIAIKAWPLMLIPLLARERRRLELGWTAVSLLACGLATLAWLGFHVVSDIAAALSTPIPISSGARVLWSTWAREVVGLPSWVAPMAAAFLALIPARGRLGIGLGILAGLTLITNLWDHYLPTFAFAALLIVAHLARAGRNYVMPKLRQGLSPLAVCLLLWILIAGATFIGLVAAAVWDVDPATRIFVTATLVVAAGLAIESSVDRGLPRLRPRRRQGERHPTN